MTQSTSLDELFCRPGFLLKRCHQVSAAIFMEECKEFDLTPSQFGAMMVLSRYPGIDQVALGRLAGLDRSTTGLVTKLLVGRELINRSVDNNDKRRMNVRLTRKGEQLLRAMMPAANRAKQRVIAGIPHEMRSIFLALLESFLIGHGANIDVAAVLGEDRASASADPS